jgi:hypothetical protein
MLFINTWAGATRCYERWLQHWAERLSQIISTVGVANVSAARCGEYLNQTAWYKRLSNSKKWRMQTFAAAAVVQGGPDSIRQFFIVNNQSIQQHTGKWESTFCCP